MMATPKTFPRWYDWLFFALLIGSPILTIVAWGPWYGAGYIVLLFVAYRLGKAIGR